MTLSGGKKYEFQAELFVRSLELYGNTPFCLTICQNPEDKLENPYLLKRAEVITHNYTFDPKWYGGLASCPQKGDVTIYTDTDMLVLDDLKQITEPAIKSVCGVIAYQSPFSNRTGWERLFDGCGVPLPKLACTANYDKKKVPYYFNLGFVAMPSEWTKDLNGAMAEYLNLSDKVMKGHYHRPQFALCLALAALKFPCHELPVQCNCPDLYGDIEGSEDMIVAHLLRTKSKVESWKDLNEPDSPNTKIMNRILDKMRFISKMRAI